MTKIKIAKKEGEDDLKSSRAKAIARISQISNQLQAAEGELRIGDVAIFKYAQITNREVEYVSLSKDLTDGDLKQRREIKSGTAYYTDQACVRAAIHGRILILDGIEKAERNVLPILNNLLENREMALDDGRFLVHPKRYDSLLKDSTTRADEMRKWKLVRTSDRFLVVALGVPVPRYEGHPLDPPLRSRFQARNVDYTTFLAQMDHLLSIISPKSSPTTQSQNNLIILRTLETIVSAAFVLRTSSTPISSGNIVIPEFAGNLDLVARILRLFPAARLRTLMNYVYPYPCMEEKVLDEEQKSVVEAGYARFGMSSSSSSGGGGGGGGSFASVENVDSGYRLVSITSSEGKCVALFDHAGSKDPRHQVQILVGQHHHKLQRHENNVPSIINHTSPTSTTNTSSTITPYIQTPYHSHLLTSLALLHASSTDICIIGAKGVGKSALLRLFTQSLLGYTVEYIPLYRDISSRDLFARRSTTTSGDTVWESSPLVKAAVEGSVAVLDGIEVLESGAVAVLQSLVGERMACLPDGRMLVSAERYAEILKKEKELATGTGKGDEIGGSSSVSSSSSTTTTRTATTASTSATSSTFSLSDIIPVHPRFRIIALARPTTSISPKGTWLTPEICAMFAFISLRNLNFEEEIQVVRGVCPGVPPEKVMELVLFAESVRSGGVQRPVADGTERSSVETAAAANSSITASAVNPSAGDDMIRDIAKGLSTRQLIRICRRLAKFPDASLYEEILKVSLYRFLPSLAKAALEKLLRDHGIAKPASTIARLESGLKLETLPPASPTSPPLLRIGDVTHPIATETNPLLIPDILFHENERQTLILKEMLKDYALGENLLLIGNQGVGKNKLADKFLQLLRLPREYIQLHRDTTVHNLTSTPSIVDGVLKFEDSPLIRAVENGYILVVDEADKAPTHVTSILKSLVEDKEMVLSDGRRIVSRHLYSIDEQDRHNYIFLHENFRMFVLANRPGFPFLGNDFFHEIGDVFACHCVDNPDFESELILLKKYAPNVNVDFLEKLTFAFNDLRKLVDEGLINYPYSTRELVSVVKHLEAYPKEGLSRALQNVFDFDHYDLETKNMLVEVLTKNGIPTGFIGSEFKVQLAEEIQLAQPVLMEQWDRQLGKRYECHTERLKINMRGGWKFDIPSKSLDLERVDARSLTFTELMYSIKLPIKGEIIDALITLNSSVLVLAAHPAALYLVDDKHRRATLIDLYEYYPLQKAMLRLKLAEVGPGKFCICNELDGTILMIDTSSKSISIITINSFTSGTLIKACISLQALQIIAFYQEGQEAIHVIDFKQNAEYLISLPFKVSALFTVTPEVWIIQSTNSQTNVTEIFMLSLKSETDRMPTMIESLKVSSKCKGACKISMVSSFASDHYDFPRQHRYSHINDLDSFLTVMGGIPNNILSNNSPGVEIRSYIRPSEDPTRNKYANLTSSHLHLFRSQQFVSVIPEESGKSEAYLEFVDPVKAIVRRLVIPVAIPMDSLLSKSLPFQANSSAYNDKIYKKEIVKLVELQDGNLASVDLTGMMRVYQARTESISTDLGDWKRLVGSLDVGTLSILYNNQLINPLESSTDGSELGLAAAGDKDGTGGGNGQGSRGEGSGGGRGQGEGGEGEGGGGASGGGGSSSAGGGGAGSADPDIEGRKSGTIDAANFNLRTANDVPKEIADATKELHSMAMKKRLEQLSMNQKDMDTFADYHRNVQREIRELRAILETVEAKNKERVWLKHQTSGDVDDTKLIEGVTGDRAIYKRRGEAQHDPGFQAKPKKMYFIFDLSASMTRFNGHDGRLDRSLECALLIMEAFKNFEHKFQYRIAGHSGDGADIVFVEEGKYPRNEKDMFMILTRMNQHAQYCLSGDHTLAAASSAIQKIKKGTEADDYFVLVLSDANLAQYNISTAAIAKALKGDDKVNAFMIFIGSIQDQAEKLIKGVPGNTFACLDNKDLPLIMKQIFLSSMLKI